MITDVTDRAAVNFVVNSPMEHSVSSSVTSLETLCIEHKWTVESFAVHMDLCTVAEYLTSPVFGSKDGRYKFNLRLYPTGKDEECRSYVSLFLMIRECPGQKIRFKVNFFVETTDGPKYCALNRHVVAINKGGIVTASKFFAVDFLKTRSQRFLPNDTLTVGVQLAIFGDTVSADVNHDDLIDNYKVPDSTLETDLQRMMDSEAHCDCELITGDTTFNCHKAVLSARSPVFAAMFDRDHNMQEANSNRCVIEDLTPIAIKSILQFIYTDTCPQLEEYAEEILPAADKYQVIRLKTKCELVLAKSISVDNVCRRLKLADKHSAPLLRSYSLAYFQEHKQDILKSESWDTVESEDPQLAAQTLREILTNPETLTAGVSLGGGGGAVVVKNHHAHLLQQAAAAAAAGGSQSASSSSGGVAAAVANQKRTAVVANLGSSLNLGGGVPDVMNQQKRGRFN